MNRRLINTLQQFDIMSYDIMQVFDLVGRVFLGLRNFTLNHILPGDALLDAWLLYW